MISLVVVSPADEPAVLPDSSCLVDQIMSDDHGSVMDDDPSRSIDGSCG